MNSIHRDIFKAIHEGKWLKIEYLNKEGRHTNYWIGIRDLDPRNKTLKVDGLHLNRCSIEGYDKIYIDSILSTEIVEGSYCPENERLIEDIALHPERSSARPQRRAFAESGAANAVSLHGPSRENAFGALRRACRGNAPPSANAARSAA